MKTKKILQIIMLGSLFSFLPVISNAQGGGTEFTDGIIIAMMSETMPKKVENIKSSKYSGLETSDTVDGKDIIHRVLTDAENKLYIGYDLEVTPQDDKGKFKVSVKPYSIKSHKWLDLTNFKSIPLPKYQTDVLVNDGDMITLDILENQQTKEKFVDFIKITRKRREFGGYFPEKLNAKDFTINDVELKLLKFDVFINDENILKVGGGASGSILYIYLKDKGRFIFSLFPQKGYDFQKVGLIEANKINFTHKGQNYSLVSNSPIVGSGGKWNLWVLYDANYKPGGMFADGSYEIGAADDMKYLVR